MMNQEERIPVMIFGLKLQRLGLIYMIMQMDTYL